MRDDNLIYENRLIHKLLDLQKDLNIDEIMGVDKTIEVINHEPPVNAVEIPETGIGDLSDGYHTFNGLYYQRMVLFAALVKAYRDRAWKSWKHHDGEIPFGGGWFIVGIETPEGQYTYHYKAEDWDLFDCQELEVAKEWDGHTEKDVMRLMSLDPNEKLKKRLKEEYNKAWEDYRQHTQVAYVMEVARQIESEHGINQNRILSQ